MSINFKQPKYILPLILLPFFFLFFFVYQSGFSKKIVEPKKIAGINNAVGAVSTDVQKQQLEDKLAAYQNAYKEGDGMTAVNALPSEKSSNASFDNTYSDKEKRMLDSINREMKVKYGQRNQQPENLAHGQDDRAMAAALQGLSKRRHADHPETASTPAPKDPMETFKQQMAYLDSMNKANDPAVKAQKAKSDAIAKAEQLRKQEPRLSVRKATGEITGFNTVMPEQNDGMIKVIIDENLTGYVSSRIRLRLLDDIIAGHTLIRKGTYLYALISGFTGQRVTLEVRSILYDGKLLPVKLNIYDLDGLAGLYVPESAFRDFTKDLGTNTIQGVTIDGSGTGSAASQFMMSTVDKVFESTSSAIAGMIRKNKAKIKYNSYLYLIDNDALENAQQQH
jgi:conjugative transposon TraM protein